MQDINFIKAKATAAAEFLAGHGIEVQHTVILEMLSRLEGHRNPQGAVPQWSPEMGTMTDAQYLVRRADCCPSCGSCDIAGGRLESENSSAWRKVKCEECRAEWVNTYKMTGYAEFEGGINLESVKSVVEDVKRRVTKDGLSIDSEAKAREAVEESWGELIGGQPIEVERKIAVMQLTS